jgi:hypothetical protein
MHARIGFALALCLFLVPVACGDDGDGGGDKQGQDTGELVVSGVVNRLPEASGGESEPFPGVEVKATVDRNGDGAISADETVVVETGDDGTYRIAVKVRSGDRVVLRYHAEDAAPVFRRVRAVAGGEVTLSVGLRSLEPLQEVQVGRLQVESKELSIDGLASGIGGAARVFNPVNEAAYFPGGFDDDQGNLLISGVFSSVSLTGDDGEVRDLEDPAELRMQLPRDTWNVVVDVIPGNDRIDVPLYAFDEVKGTWVREGEGYLEDGRGAVIPEDQLPAVNDGTFEGTIYSAGVVRHFSYWNVDWPVETYGCLSGRVLLEDGSPAVGAMVTASGETYTGYSNPVTTDAEGRFCVEMMRSEGPGEDVDQDGIPGETHRIRLRISRGTAIYDGGVHDAPVEQGTCGGACGDVGDVTLDESTKMEAGLCTVTGKVSDLRGRNVEGAVVYAWDDTVPEDVWTSVCLGDGGFLCMSVATTDAGGNFAVGNAIFEGLSVIAVATGEEAGAFYTRLGERRYTSCPTEPVEIRLDTGWDSYELEFLVDGETIEWRPALPLQWLYVVDSNYQYKWAIAADDEGRGFSGPVSYGVLPSGTSRYSPPEGETVLPLEPGDRIGGYGYGITTAGYEYYASGETALE